MCYPIPPRRNPRLRRAAPCTTTDLRIEVRDVRLVSIQSLPKSVIIQGSPSPFRTTDVAYNRHAGHRMSIGCRAGRHLASGCAHTYGRSEREWSGSLHGSFMFLPPAARLRFGVRPFFSGDTARSAYGYPRPDTPQTSCSKVKVARGHVERRHYMAADVSVDGRIRPPVGRASPAGRVWFGSSNHGPACRAANRAPGITASAHSSTCFRRADVGTPFSG